MPDHFVIAGPDRQSLSSCPTIVMPDLIGHLAVIADSDHASLPT